MTTVTLRFEDQMKKDLDLDATFYSEANMARLKKSIAQLNAGEGQEHELVEVE